MHSREVIPHLTRRRSLALLGGFSTLSFIPSIACTINNQTQKSTGTIQGYDLQNPIDRMLIFEKIAGDLSGKLTYSLSRGRVFGIRPDITDDLGGFGREVLRFTGCSMRIKRVLDNGNVETKSRSWLLYRDPATDEFVTEYVNPYTAELLEVKPFIGGISGGVMTPNGPQVNANFSMESTIFGKPMPLVFNVIGDRVHMSRHAFTKWHEKKTDTYRTEMTLDNYDFDRKFLDERHHEHIPADIHWTSQTAWLSLLKMKEVPGHMIWSSNSNVLFDADLLPQGFVDATMQREPEIFSKPLTWDS